MHPGRLEDEAVALPLGAAADAGRPPPAGVQDGREDFGGVWSTVMLVVKF
ncbi:hypothetical protein KHQ06_04570 [Nocardia tengchongensis]|uniref:Uncharacterized protein n=1 Tax=Nocardia tengchongensis TaxID=2055889 RepID=A0ABX8CR23_9NOCA|nr:hypothetical protein [Nocardia tengchongensis]QVI22371.1 hypothetical protein KHQ06_04570 [Nocardia tengchongensis]